MSATAAAVFWDLVEESLGEASFLWEMREAALVAPDRTPVEVEAAIEERLRGAIEGLTVPGADIAGRLLAPALASDEWPAVAVAAHALLAGGTAAGRDQFCAAFREARGRSLEALRRGLELASTGDLWVALGQEMAGADPEVQAAFLEARAFRGLPFGAPDAQWLSPSAHPGLQRGAARLLRHVPPSSSAGWLPQALALSDPAARRRAIETGLILGERVAWALCRDQAEAAGAGRGQALLAVAILGTERDHDRLTAMLGDPRWQREAIWALGFGGRRAGADACLDLLAQDQQPRLAAEAFSAITGLDLREADLAVAPPPEPEDQPAGEKDVVLDAEGALPLADVAGVIRWWNRQRPRFEAGVRYLGGRPITLGCLGDALLHGPMRRRRPLAFELAVRTQGRVQVETGAFLAEQRRRLSAVDWQPGARRADTSAILD
ncbi:MAG TPA: TIGR02270 family protein [Polyangia bacterium]|nr:TIGR02270 family protein [Polyangia bacterium]